jgi:hypothetical protein
MMERASNKDSADAGKAGLKDKVRSEGRVLAGEAKSSAARIAGRQRDAVSGYISALAMAAAAGGETLDASGYPRSGATMLHTADEVDNFARHLETREPGEIWHDVENFARKHPVLVFGTGFAVAFGVTRFLKSSAPEAGTGPEEGPTERKGDTPQSSA